MKAFFVWVVAVCVVGMMGCAESTTSVVQCGNDGAGGEGVIETASSPFLTDAGACEVTEVVETVLPAVGLGDVIAFCTNCDEGKCDPLGEPCGSYGEPCQFAGQPGVCVSCCAGTTGELRCGPL